MLVGCTRACNGLHTTANIGLQVGRGWLRDVTDAAILNLILTNLATIDGQHVLRNGILELKFFLTIEKRQKNCRS